MKKSTCFVLALACAYAFCSRAGVIYDGNPWKAVGGAWDGEWTNTAHWTRGSLTGAGRLYLAADAAVDAYTVTVPQGVCTNLMSALTVDPSGGKEITIDATGSVFEMPQRGEATYQSVPLNLGAGGQNIFKMRDGNDTSAVMKLAGGRLVADATQDGVSEIAFHGGTFDFYRTLYLFVPQNEMTNIVRFTDGASLAATMIQNQCMGRHNQLIFDGGTHTVVSGWQMPYNGHPAYGFIEGVETETEIRLENGAKLTTPSIFFSPTGGNAGSLTNKTLRVTVDHATLECTSGFQNTHGGRLVCKLVNGSNYTITPTTSGAGAFWLGNDTASTGIVNVVNSTASCASIIGRVELGVDQDGSWGELNVLTNGLFVIGYKDFMVTRGRLTLASGGLLEAGKLNGAANAGLIGDGGTYRYHHNINVGGAWLTTCLQGFGSAKCGAGGLTILNTENYDLTVAQSFTDLDGAEGELIVSTGAKTVTLAGTATDVSKIVVAKGTVAFASGASPDSVLVVTNGASANLANVMSLRGLVIGDAASMGLLRIASTTPVAVSGDVDLRSVTLKLDATFAEGTYALFNVTGDVSATSVRAWQRAIVASGLLADKVADFTVEDAGGAKLLKLTIRDPEAVTLAVSEGTQVITENQTWPQGDTMRVVVSNGASCDITGTLGDGRFEKAGSGKLTLGGTGNYFAYGFSLLGGLLYVESAGALGYVSDAVNSILRNGTLEFGGTEPIRLSNPIDMSAETTYGAAVIKTGCDVTMPLPYINLGSLIKRGAGRLTFEVSDNKTLNRSGNLGHCNAYSAYPSRYNPLVFDDAQGNVPYSEEPAYATATFHIYNPLSIAEGQLVIRGTSETIPTVAYSGGGGIGLVTTNGTAVPTLVLDHVYYNVQANSRYWVMSSGVPGGAYLNRDTALVVTNGATAYFQTGFYSQNDVYYNTLQAVTSRIDIVDHATFRSVTDGGGTFYGAANNTANTGISFYSIRGDSAFYRSNTAIWNGTAKFFVDDSIVAGSPSLEPTTFAIYPAAAVASEFAFANKSRFYGVFVSGKDTVAMTHPVRFSNAEWVPVTTGDYAFGETNITYSIAVENEGLILAPAEGVTWTMSREVSGPGGLVKRGDGTLVLPGTNLLFTGVVRVEAGVIDFGGTAVNGGRFAGAGALRNGSLANPTFALAADDDWVVAVKPTLDTANGLSITGRVVVDLGRTAADALERPFHAVEVAIYTGAAPDVSQWKLTGTGIKNTVGEFTAEDGKVYVMPTQGGLVMVFR